MISFLIPTYNYDCTELVSELSKQARALSVADSGFSFEIIVADDGSRQEEREALRAGLQNVSGCQLVELPTNVGRARGLNFLIGQASFPNIVIIDSDALVCTPDFVGCYWEHCGRADVVCGSLRNPSGGGQPGCELRMRYERAMEQRRTAAYRNAHPYSCFTTFNVMFRKSVLETVRFDERCTEYGYEDTLLGLMLEKNGFSVLHIDNPLVHNGIDTNKSFLGKTEAAMRTLSRLGEPIQSEAGASRLCKRLARLHLLGLLRTAFLRLRTPLRRQLLGPRPNLLLFNIYKAGYYSTLIK
ncbi:MAG: glycosyltransferase family 2 protein [Alloprevotella sp.]|nr:glycosyltransferase family 2 protein [Alloprevotella sp.]